MRKRIDLEVKGLQTPRERVWAAIRSLKKGFTRASVRRRLRPVVCHHCVDDYFAELLAAGFIVKACTGKRRPGRGSVADSDTFDLVKDQFEAPRVTTGGRLSTKGLGALAMWRVIRMLPRGFDYQEVARLGIGRRVRGEAGHGEEVRERARTRRVLRRAPAGHPTRRPATAWRATPGRTRRSSQSARRVRPQRRHLHALQTAQEVCDGIE
jgi:hypothetical protein